MKVVLEYGFRSKLYYYYYYYYFNHGQNGSYNNKMVQTTDFCDPSYQEKCDDF